MKKTLYTALALLTSSATWAATSNDLRIFIDPGHGSWTVDDRPCTLIGHGPYSATATDTLSFFESNTNLRKAFGVLEKMREYGFEYNENANSENTPARVGAARDLTNNIVMGHVKCGPYLSNNGTLSQMGANAAPELAYYNRNLIEVAQEVDVNNFDLCVVIHSNALTDGAVTNYPLLLYRGRDAANMSQESGITAQFQTQSRALSQACWGYAIENPHSGWTNYTNGTMNLRGDRDFYANSLTGARQDVKGYLNALKHTTPGFLAEGYFHTYQPARHRAMNWDVDYIEGYAYAHGIADYLGLQKETNGHIYGIVRDAKETFSHQYYTPNPKTEDIYKPLNGVTVHLMQGDTEVATYLTDNYYNGAFVFRNVAPGEYTLTFDAEGYVSPEPVKVTVDAATVSYPSVTMVSTSWVKPEDQYEDYPDPVTSRSVCAADEYAFRNVYSGVQGADEAMAVTAYGDYLFLRTRSGITVFDATQGKTVKDVAIENPCAMALTADGTLLACGSNGDVYYYAKDQLGLPQEPANVLANTGKADHMAYSGTISNGTMYTAHAKGVRTYTVAGAKAEMISDITLDADIETLAVSPLHSDCVMVGIEGELAEIQPADGSEISRTTSIAPGSRFLKIAGHTLAVSASDGHIALADITAGLEKASSITATGLDAVSAGTVVLGYATANTDAEGHLTGADINLLTVGNGNISRYTTSGVAQPTYTPGYAYGLDMTNQNGLYTFTAQTVGQPKKLAVVLTHTEHPETTFTIPMTDGQATLDAATLDQGEYTWAVTATNHPVTKFAKTASYARTDLNGANCRGGVVPMTDPAYPSFGYTVVAHGFGSGLDVYNPQHQLLGRVHKNSVFDTADMSSPMRGTQADGVALFADWSKNSSGIWAFDPSDFETVPANIIAGTRDANGVFTHQGTEISGRTSTVAIYGDGDSRQLIAFRCGSDGKHSLVRHDIGSNLAIDRTHDYDYNGKITNASLMLNTNVHVAPTSHGLFVSQQRAAGNNVASVPAWVFIDHQGKVLLNSADVDGIDSGSTGIAVNADESLLACGTYAGINIYALEWDNDTPSLEFLNTLSFGYCDWTHLNFDHLGQLHAYQRNSGYHTYSVVNPKPDFTTPAPLDMTVHSVGTSVKSITVNQTGDAEYFDLNGRRINPGYAAPGIYIKRQGDSATKIIIR